MPNEFIARNGLIALDSSQISGSLFVSASVTAVRGFTGSLFGTASLATTASFALSSSFASTVNTITFNNSGSGNAPGTIYSGSSAITVSFNTIGANKTILTGSTVPQAATGSDGDIYILFDATPVSMSISSSLTASLDCTLGIYYTLTLSSSATTHIVSSNIQPGATLYLQLNQPATSGSVTFDSSFRFPFGTTYTGSASGSAVDILTLTSFNSSSLFTTVTRY